jgi:hypothetical protein
MQSTSPLYVESPTIPEGVSYREYMRQRAASRHCAMRVRLAARIRRATTRASA